MKRATRSAAVSMLGEGALQMQVEFLYREQVNLLPRVVGRFFVAVKRAGMSEIAP